MSKVQVNFLQSILQQLVKIDGEHGHSFSTIGIDLQIQIIYKFRQILNNEKTYIDFDSLLHDMLSYVPFKSFLGSVNIFQINQFEVYFLRGFDHLFYI